MTSEINQDDKLDHILIGMCNPLLDMSANTPKEFVEKFDLKVGSTYMVQSDSDKQKAIFRELAQNYKVQYIPGGAALNSVRVFAWMVQKKNAASFFGCVGKDEFSEKMLDACHEDGVNTLFMRDEKTETGACAACISDKERTLIADLGAAQNFKISHLMTEENQLYINKAKYFYISGFVLTHSTDSVEYLGKHCCENNKTFLINLSAPFVMQFFMQNFLKVLPYSDYIFGNEHEIAACGVAMKYDTTDPKEIAIRLSQEPKANKQRGRTVVITQGPAHIIYVKSSFVNDSDDKPTKLETSKSYTPLPIPIEEIVDTNGAGDSFVGGFLSQLVLGKDADVCINAGAYAAYQVLHYSGCRFPKVPQFDEKDSWVNEL